MFILFAVRMYTKWTGKNADISDGIQQGWFFSAITQMFLIDIPSRELTCNMSFSQGTFESMTFLYIPGGIC